MAVEAADHDDRITLFICLAMVLLLDPPATCDQCTGCGIEILDFGRSDGVGLLDEKCGSSAMSSCVVCGKGYALGERNRVTVLLGEVREMSDVRLWYVYFLYAYDRIFMCNCVD